MSRTKTRGEGNASAKLTRAKVYGIRAYRLAGLNLQNIADLYEVSKTQIWRIIHRKNWAWL